MTVLQVLARVLENEEIIPGHKVLVCRAPEIAAIAQPGQFLNVLASGTYESILRKPFSIFRSDPSSGAIAMLYQVYGATTLGMAAKQSGDSVDLVGPLGGKVFTLDPRPDAVHIMVGGGYGVPPLVFLAKQLIDTNPSARIVVIVGARKKELLLCEAELTGLGVEFAPATEDGSHGVKGRVTDVCMGCVLDLADGRRVRSCTEGPVFQASEVIWK